MIAGFNAEASLYRTTASYVAAARPVHPQEVVGASVTPQLVQSCWAVCGGDPDCLHCCQCVRRGGDPSQCCF